MVKFESIIKKIISDTLYEKIEWTSTTNNQCIRITDNTDNILKAFVGDLYLENKKYSAYFIEYKILTDNDEDIIYYKLVICNDSSIIITFSDSEVNKTYFLRLNSAINAHNKDAKEFQNLLLGKNKINNSESITESDVSVSSMKEWFLEHYEDPAEKTPFDSSEGGYLYKKDEPYDAKEVLYKQFHDDCSEEMIEQAANELEEENLTNEWVLK